MSKIDKISLLLDEIANEGNCGSSSSVIERLMPLVYEELRTLARCNRYRWRGANDPGTTSLVHEAYLKLAHGQINEYRHRGQFFALASKAMRSILIDNARWHQRQKRGGSARKISFDNLKLVSATRSDELLDLDDALVRLETTRPDLAETVVLQIFGGLTINETATALEVSAATIKRRWTLAKTWLHQELKQPDSVSPQHYLT